MFGLLLLIAIVVSAYLVGKNEGKNQALREFRAQTEPVKPNQQLEPIKPSGAQTVPQSNVTTSPPPKIVSGLYYYAGQAEYNLQRGLLIELANSIIEKRDPELSDLIIENSQAVKKISDKVLIDKADKVPFQTITSGLRFYMKNAESSYLKSFLFELASSIEQQRNPVFQDFNKSTLPEMVEETKQTHHANNDISYLHAAPAYSSSVAPAVVAKAQQVSSPKEKVNPFELLRNINILLFTGAFLVILTVIIFVVSNFAELSGWQKVIVVGVFGLIFYLSGLLLFARFKKLKPAGVAFTIIGLVTIPFSLIAFRSYVAPSMSLSGLWLLLSSMMLIVSLLTGLVTRWKSMKFVGLVSLAVGVLSSVILLPLDIPVGFFTFYILAILYELGSGYIKDLKSPLHILSLLIFSSTAVANIFGLFYFEFYQVGISLLLGVAYLFVWWFIHPNQSETQKEANVFTATFLSWIAVGTFIYEFNDDLLKTAVILFVISLVISLISMIPKLSHKKIHYIGSSLFLTGLSTGLIFLLLQLTSTRSFATSLMVLSLLYAIQAVVRRSQVLVYASSIAFFFSLFTFVYKANILPSNSDQTIIFTICLLVSAAALAGLSVYLGSIKSSQFAPKLRRSLVILSWTYLTIGYCVSIFSDDATTFFAASSILSLSLLWQVVRHKRAQLMSISAVVMTIAWIVFGSFGPSWITQVDLNYILLSLSVIRLLSGHLYHQKAARISAVIIGLLTLFLNYIVSLSILSLTSNEWMPVVSLIALVVGLFYASWQHKELWFMYGFGLALSYPAILSLLNKLSAPDLSFEQATMSFVVLSIFYSLIGVIQNALFATRVGLISRYGAMVPLVFMLIFPNSVAVIIGTVVLALQVYVESYLSIFKAKLDVRVLASGIAVFALSRIFWQFDVTEPQAYVGIWAIYSFVVAIIMELKSRKTASIIWQVLGLMIMLPILLVQTFIHQFDWHAWLLIAESVGLIFVGKLPGRPLQWARSYALLACSVLGIYFLSQSFSQNWSLQIAAVIMVLSLFASGWLYKMQRTLYSIGMAVSYFAVLSVVDKLLSGTLTLEGAIVIVTILSIFYSALGWLLKLVQQNSINIIFRFGAIIPLVLFVFAPTSASVIVSIIVLSVMISLEGWFGGYKQKLDIKLLAVAGLFFALTRTFLQLEVTEFQAYALSWSLYSLIVVLAMERAKRVQASMLWQAIGLVVLTVPLFLQTMFNELDWHVLLLFVEAVGLIVLGAVLRRDIFWRFGVVTLVLQSLYQFGGAIFALPRILLGFIVGLSLLGAGIYFLWKRNDDDSPKNDDSVAR